MDKKTGKVSYCVNDNGTGKPVELNANSKKLVEAIDDHSVNVNVVAENTTTTASGSPYIGCAFSGNTVTNQNVPKDGTDCFFL